MSSILLSIKPEYVERIFAGIKLYEYRRRLPQKKIDKIIVYATQPIMKVLGEVEVVELISGRPTTVWMQTKEKSGISKEKFKEYFDGCETAYAHQLGQSTVYTNPKPLSAFGLAHPPQSFAYVSE